MIGVWIFIQDMHVYTDNGSWVDGIGMLSGTPCLDCIEKLILGYHISDSKSLRIIKSWLRLLSLHNKFSETLGMNERHLLTTIPACRRSWRLDLFFTLFTLKLSCFKARVPTGPLRYMAAESFNVQRTKLCGH